MGNCVIERNTNQKEEVQAGRNRVMLGSLPVTLEAAPGGTAVHMLSW